jgi:5-formyltetrahydrofolate cyclo-ligase
MTIWEVSGDERDVVKAHALESPEPTGSVEIDPADVDLVLVPGRAFDRAGNRLGRGGGFYDSFLADRAPQAFRAAAAYGAQIIGEVPHNENDEPVDAIVTESETIRTDARAG